MTVRELVNEFAGKKVRIGAINGSSFFWIGTVTDALTKDMDVLTEVFRKRYEKAWDKVVKATPLVVRQNTKTFLKVINDTYEGKCSVSQDWTDQRKKQTARVDSMRRVLTALDLYERAYYEKEMFTPLNDREVKEIYGSQIEPDVTIIRIDGYDNGYAWDESEWKGLAKK